MSMGEAIAPSWEAQPPLSFISIPLLPFSSPQVRHGIMVIGPAGAGKTSVMESLAAAHTRLGAKTVLWRMNPKSMRAEQMFGQVDPATGEWTDGVFAVLWRRAAQAQHQHTWIVMDGPIDAIWIENLNSVSGG